jgi:hypothetical protein
MTDEAKAFRIFIPIVIIIVFVLIGRTCSRKSETTASPGASPAQSASAPAPAPGGLKIEGSPSQVPTAKEATFPDGLDAERVQYLVEIDGQFSTPVVMNLSKTFDGSEIARTLQSKKYIEKGPDGSTQITRDGLMALDLTDLGDRWSFPIAKRTFDKVSYVSRVDDDKYDVTISWHYDPTRIGSELGIKPTPKSASARFVGRDRDWALSSWVAPPTASPTG